MEIREIRRAPGFYTLLLGTLLTAAAVAYLGPQAYRKYSACVSLGESERYKLERLDEKAVSPQETPAGLEWRLRYLDSDSDGDFESYIAWHNRLGPDMYILMEKGNKGKAVFPDLSAKAVRPDENPAPFQIDYHYMDETKKTESIMYQFSSRLYSEDTFGYVLKPVIVERDGRGYWWRETTGGSRSDGGKHRMKTRAKSPLPPGIHKKRSRLAGR